MILDFMTRRSSYYIQTLLNFVKKEQSSHQDKSSTKVYRNRPLFFKFKSIKNGCLDSKLYDHALEIENKNVLTSKVYKND